MTRADELEAIDTAISEGKLRRFPTFATSAEDGFYSNRLKDFAKARKRGIMSMNRGQPCARKNKRP